MHLCNLSTSLCLIDEKGVPFDLTMHLSAAVVPCFASQVSTPPYRDQPPFGQSCAAFVANSPFHSTRPLAAALPPQVNAVRCVPMQSGNVHQRCRHQS